MSITITEDLAYGQRIRRNRDGDWATRALLVKGLNAAAPPPALFGSSFQVENQPAGTLGRVPDWGDNHPIVTTALCLEVEQCPFPDNSRYQLRVVASYGPPDLLGGWKITVTGVGGTRTITTDDQGNALVKIRYPNPNSPKNGPTGGNYVQIVDADYFAPGSVVVFEHDEYSSPFAKVATFQCTTNSQPFLGFDADQVLCRDIRMESFVSATRWHVSYIFEICPDPLGWRRADYYRTANGIVPSDVSGTKATTGCCSGPRTAC